MGDDVKFRPTRWLFLILVFAITTVSTQNCKNQKNQLEEDEISLGNGGGYPGVQIGETEDYVVRRGGAGRPTPIPWLDNDMAAYFYRYLSENDSDPCRSVTNQIYPKADVYSLRATYNFLYSDSNCPTNFTEVPEMNWGRIRTTPYNNNFMSFEGKVYERFEAEANFSNVKYTVLHCQWINPNLSIGVDNLIGIDVIIQNASDQFTAQIYLGRYIEETLIRKSQVYPFVVSNTKELNDNEEIHRLRFSRTGFSLIYNHYDIRDDDPYREDRRIAILNLVLGEDAYNVEMRCRRQNFDLVN